MMRRTIEALLSKRRVLAISNDLDQLRRIVSTLERAGAEVDAVRSVETIAGSLIPHRYVFYSATGKDPEAKATGCKCSMGEGRTASAARIPLALTIGLVVAARMRRRQVA